MARFFQLIDLSSGNVTGEFATSQEAQQFLIAARRELGDEVLDYAVAEMDELGNVHRAIQEDELLTWIESGIQRIGSAAD